jgi:hypothetical protein
LSLYHDPSLSYLRPSLIGDLLSVPATKEQHQLENQTTTVLAWLVDQCPAIADAVLRLSSASTRRATARLELAPS